MTSIMNLPAIYSTEYYKWFDGWVLSINGVPDLVYDTKEEAEQAAREHYKKNNWTAEDQAEQEYFDRHPIEEK